MREWPEVDVVRQRVLHDDRQPVDGLESQGPDVQVVNGGLQLGRPAGHALLQSFVQLTHLGLGLLASGTALSVGALLVYCGLMFALGTADDVWHMRPGAKLAGQAVVTAVFLAIAPRISLTGIALIDLPLVFVWLVGITNALNLLDNIDGLCAGIAGIAGVFAVKDTL